MLLIASIFGQLISCQTQFDGGDRKSQITDSTFTESDGWQIWLANIKALNTQQLTWVKDEAYYPRNVKRRLDEQSEPRHLVHSM